MADQNPLALSPASIGNRSNIARELSSPHAWSRAAGVAWVNPSAACSSGVAPVRVTAGAATGPGGGGEPGGGAV